MALPNYVKFQRGTKLAFENLSQKDQNTLYFIYDPRDETKGKLYLGNRLIGGIGEGGGATSISDLTDVIIEGANTGDFLVRDSAGNWKSISATDVAQLIVTAGGNFVTIDEEQFQFNSVNGKLELKGYAEADFGFIPVKGNNGLIWQAAPSSIDLSGRVGNLESAMLNAQSDINNLQSEFQSVDGKIASAIESLNHLTYQIINNISEATATNVVYLIANNDNINDNIYTEYMLINGQLEVIGSTNVDLSQYATTNDLLLLDSRVSNLEGDLNDYVTMSHFESVVGDFTLINGAINNLNSDASISETIIDIYDRLTWQEISE